MTEDSSLKSERNNVDEWKNLRKKEKKIYRKEGID